MDREMALNAVASLQTGAAPTSEEYHALRAEMGHYLRGAWPTLSEADLSEAVDAAIERFLTVGRRPRLVNLPPDRALAYLLRSAKNGQIDRFRRPKSASLENLDRGEAGSTADDELLRWIDHAATLQSVNQVLTHLDEQGDDLAVQVVVVWLDLADAYGRAPSARQVAAELGKAHTTVSRAMARFRAELTSLMNND